MQHIGNGKSKCEKDKKCATERKRLITYPKTVWHFEYLLMFISYTKRGHLQKEKTLAPMQKKLHRYIIYVYALLLHMENIFGFVDYTLLIQSRQGCGLQQVYWSGKALLDLLHSTKGTCSNFFF